MSALRRHPSRPRTAVIVAFAVILQVSVAPAAGAQSGSVRYIVGVRSVPPAARAGATHQGEKIVGVNRSIRFVTVDARRPSTFLAKVRRDPNTRYVERDLVQRYIDPGASASYTPGDPRWSSQYGPQQIRADQVWDTTLGTTGAAVCILDTGVRRSHEDIGTARWLGWRDYVGTGSTPYDDEGHGTHVAGIAAATIDNGKGIAGVGNVGIYGVKVLDSSGNGSFSAIANGITWCADNTIQRTVLNLSLGGTFGSQTLLDAVRYAYNTKGRLVVAATGNGGCSNCVEYPGKYAEVVAVSCTTSSEASCSFSSKGPENELSAPGQGIVSTYNRNDTDYVSADGTSMSTPHVAGATALVWSSLTSLTAQQLRQRARDTARDLGTAGFDNTFGYGRIDALCLLRGTAYPCPGGSPPTEPLSVSATAGPGAGQIGVNWQTPASNGGTPITGYRVHRATSAGGPYSLVATLGVTLTYTDSGLGNGATRYYRISALNAAGEGAQSSSATATTFSTPGAPQSLGASPAGSGEITLSWQQPATDGGTSLTGFKVYRATAAGGPYSSIATLGPSSSSFTDTGLPDSATRYYRLSATNLVGEGPQSNEASATTAAAVPGAPGSVAASAGPGVGQISVSWAAPPGGPITGYRLYSAPAAGGSYTLVATTGPATFGHVDGGLGNGVTRHYKVSALNGTTEGPSSLSAAATTFAAPGAPSPASASAGPGAGEIEVTWHAPASDGGTAVTGYRVLSSETPGGPYANAATTGAASLTFTHAGLGNGATRYYRVRALNAVGEGAQTGEVSATTFTPPSAPQGLVASAGPGGGQISLAWNAPAVNGGAPISGYEVHRSEAPSGPFTQVGATAGTTFVDSGLPPGATRFYRVAASNAAGRGSLSNTASATTLLPPTQPRNVSATGGLRAATVRWDPPASSGGGIVTGYRLYRADDATGPFTLRALVGSATLEHEDGGLSDATTVYYRVSAVGTAGEGPQSGTVTATTFGLPSAPGAPSAATGPGRGAITVSWGAPASDGGTQVTGFRIYRDAGAGYTQVAETAPGVTTYLDEGLADGASMSYEIAALNQVGEGPRAGPASAATLGPPGAPADLTATPGPGLRQITLSWGAPASDGGSPVAGYRIYRATEATGPYVLLSVTGAAARSFTDGSRDVLLAYHYRVTAINEVGEGAGADACSRPAPWPAALAAC